MHCPNCGRVLLDKRRVNVYDRSDKMVGTGTTRYVRKEDLPEPYKSIYEKMPVFVATLIDMDDGHVLYNYDCPIQFIDVNDVKPLEPPKRDKKPAEDKKRGTRTRMPIRDLEKWSKRHG